mmetsp:Transcript_24953/g.78348  ORF Transcript_24953/g.78348 Transcript_24953/m.78348 type:complete len:213 (-) Transcript_24953:66-704(-)
MLAEVAKVPAQVPEAARVAVGGAACPELLQAGGRPLCGQRSQILPARVRRQGLQIQLVVPARVDPELPREGHQLAPRLPALLGVALVQQPAVHVRDGPLKLQPQDPDGSLTCARGLRQRQAFPEEPLRRRDPQGVLALLPGSRSEACQGCVQAVARICDRARRAVLVAGRRVGDLDALLRDLCLAGSHGLLRGVLCIALSAHRGRALYSCGG